ncbi:hypothetical protein RJ640_004581 [Escallonia rubra]|uniref:F-box domain-containing protein n=1 Tax=Escallonia rubra TaxID=112253 RepID=A0AA88RKT8_9ASTE|nr:hypothetical protein RJ640_004581 [Escallonia rubra]
METTSRRQGSSNRSITKQEIRCNTSDGTDYISYLPSEVLLHIFYFLPLKYWVIMSLVSKQWKYLWTQISILNLDEDELVTNMIRKTIPCPSCSMFPNHHSRYQRLQHALHAARRQFAAMVNRILLFHSGCTIQNFRLACRHGTQDAYAPMVDKWVQFCMTSNIIELEFNFSSGMPQSYYNRDGLVVRRNTYFQPYAFPRHAFEPKILKILTLYFCKFEASSFGAFRSLQRLSLIHVEILDCSIGDLVSKCSTLEDLSMKHCFQPDKFFICAQELKIKSFCLIHCMTENWAKFPIDITTPDLLTLTIVGSYLMSTSVKRATKLLNVKVDIAQGFEDHAQGNFLASLLLDLYHCPKIALSSCCLQVLPIGDGLRRLMQLPLQNLKHIRLRLRSVKEELPGISCLLRSSPKLERLYLDVDMPLEVEWDAYLDMIPHVFEFEAQSYWESQSEPPIPCLQNCLKKVNIYGFTGKSIEMEMIKFLLENAIVLEKLNVYYYGLHPAASGQQHLNYKWVQFRNLVSLMTLPKARSQARVKMSRLRDAVILC